MKISEYQQLAARTLLASPDREYTHQEMMIVWDALGLAGEAGEVAEDVKKAIFHNHGVDIDKLTKEIGDVMWYVAALCTTAGISLEEVMQQNIDKLRIRYPDGYNSRDSISRVDVK